MSLERKDRVNAIGLDESRIWRRFFRRDLAGISPSDSKVDERVKLLKTMQKCSSKEYIFFCPSFLMKTQEDP